MAAQHPSDGASICILEPLEAKVGKRGCLGSETAMSLCPLSRQRRDQAHGDKEREENGNRECSRERPKEVSHHTLEEAEWGEDDDSGDGRPGDRTEISSVPCRMT